MQLHVVTCFKSCSTGCICVTSHLVQATDLVRKLAKLPERQALALSRSMKMYTMVVSMFFHVLCNTGYGCYEEHLFAFAVRFVGCKTSWTCSNAHKLTQYLMYLLV